MDVAINDCYTQFFAWLRENVHNIAMPITVIFVNNQFYVFNILPFGATVSPSQKIESIRGA